MILFSRTTTRCTQRCPKISLSLLRCTSLIFIYSSSLVFSSSEQNTYFYFWYNQYCAQLRAAHNNETPPILLLCDMRIRFATFTAYRFSERSEIENSLFVSTTFDMRTALTLGYRNASSRHIQEYPVTDIFSIIWLCHLFYRKGSRQNGPRPAVLALFHPLLESLGWKSDRNAYGSTPHSHFLCAET